MGALGNSYSQAAGKSQDSYINCVRDHDVVGAALKANIAKHGDHELGSAAHRPNFSSSSTPNTSTTRESFVKISTYNNNYVKRERDHQHQLVISTTTHPAATQDNLDQMNVERGVNSLKSTTLGGGGCDDDDEGNGRKKLMRLTKERSVLNLEDMSFKEHTSTTPLDAAKQKQALSNKLNLRPKQVDVCFQNRSAMIKLKHAEVDCQLLQRCCETLTDENKRLHKELQELRAMVHLLSARNFLLKRSYERIAALQGGQTSHTSH